MLSMMLIEAYSYMEGLEVLLCLGRRLRPRAQRVWSSQRGQLAEQRGAWTHGGELQTW